MNYDIDHILAVEDGDIKVEIQDLRELHSAIKEGNMDFVDIFMKKYIELTAVRREEKQAYTYYELAKKLATGESKEQQFVNNLRKEYTEIRNDRIDLQKEIKDYEYKHDRIDRLSQMFASEQEKSQGINPSRFMGKSR